MSERKNPSIVFDNDASTIIISADKDSKYTVNAKWTEWQGEHVEETSRYIPIHDLYRLLIDKDKYIDKCAKDIRSHEIDALRETIALKTKELRTANATIEEQKNKISAYKTIIKEMKEDRGT